MKQTKTVKLYEAPFNDLNRFFDMMRGIEPILKGTAYTNIKFKIENFFNEAIPSSDGDNRCQNHLVIYGDREETDLEYSVRLENERTRYMYLHNKFMANKEYLEYLELKNKLT